MKIYKIIRLLAFVCVSNISLYAMQTQLSEREINKIASSLNCESCAKLCESLALIPSEQLKNENLVSSALLVALKKYNKSILMQDKFKATILHYTCGCGQNNLVHIILVAAKMAGDDNLRALLLAQHNNGSTALHWAALPGAHAECIKENLQAAKNCNDNYVTLKNLITITNHLGYNPLHSACHMAYTECAEALIYEASLINDNFSTLKHMLDAKSNQRSTASRLARMRLRTLTRKENSDEKEVLVQEAEQCIQVLETACAKSRNY